MAPEMQIPAIMRSVRDGFLTLILTSGLLTAPFAIAEDSDCLKAYREANAKFNKTRAEIVRGHSVAAQNKAAVETERNQTLRKAGAGTFAALGIACVVFKNKAGLSIPGIVGCAAVVEGIAAGMYAHARWLGSQIEKTYDAQRIFQAYSAVRNGDIEESEEAKEFVKELGVKNADAKLVLGELAGLIDNGALCEGKRTFEYQEALDVVKARPALMNAETK